MRILTVLLISVLSFLFACTDEKSVTPVAKVIALKLNGFSRGDAASQNSSRTDEESIWNLHVSFFSESTGARVGRCNIFTAGTIDNGRVSISDYPDELLNQEVKVVVVANADNVLSAALVDCTDRNSLSSVVTDSYTTGFILPPTMFGEIIHTFTVGQMTAFVNEVQRLPAKIELKCTPDPDHPCTIDVFTWDNIPVQSSCTPDQTGVQTKRGSLKTNTIMLEDGKSAGFGYPYAYKKGDSRAKVKISTTRQDGTKGYYYFLLPEELKRNHWYTYDLQLAGPGGTEENPVKVKVNFAVLPWEEESNNIIIGNSYLECDNELYLFVRTLGSVINPKRNFIFHTNVPLSDCEVIPEDQSLLTSDILPVQGGGIINLKTKENVFYEFHPRVKTAITIKAGNISRKVNVTLIPLIEIHPKRPNIIMVWLGHEFYNQAAKYGGLYLHTPTRDGMAENFDPIPNMCQKIEIYDQDYYPSLEGKTGCQNNYISPENNKYYYEDFGGEWRTITGVQINTGVDPETVTRIHENYAEILGNAWRFPTEYELRCIYQAWAFFGRPLEMGGSDTPPGIYQSEEEKELYRNARMFYQRFQSAGEEYGDQYVYGCTTFTGLKEGVDADGNPRGNIILQAFRYLWRDNTWISNPFIFTKRDNVSVFMRPVRDYSGSSQEYEENTWQPSYVPNNMY